MNSVSTVLFCFREKLAWWIDWIHQSSNTEGDGQTLSSSLPAPAPAGVVASWVGTIPATIWDTGVRTWYHCYFPVSLIEWRKFICSWETCRSVLEPFCWGLGKLGFNLGSGSILHCEFESQLGFGMKVQENLGTRGWKLLHQCFLWDRSWLCTQTTKYHITCWHSLSAGLFPVHSFSVHDKLEASSTEAAGGWKLR